jgi:hypothetical protein
MAKGSLLPENAVGGAGMVPDGDYTIKDITAHMFDYGGKADAVPAIAVVYATDDGTTYEQNYSAGKGSSLVEPADGKRFEVIGKNSNAWAWIGSMLKGGFPTASVDDDVTVFKGCRVTVENVAQQKRPGLKDQTEGKTIPLVTKVVALPAAKGAVKAPVRPTSAAPAKATPAQAAPATATAPTNGEVSELDIMAIEVIQGIVATAPENTITRLKLGTAVMLGLAKAKNPNMAAIKRLATDPAWLTSHAELGGWSTDGETITVG